ncbi:hypothetical protein BJP40_05055 [Streptomyces sp. CC53]|uniref:hypothetical protein n=1 Tax=unclassified Streptomyces TaxID=2593676 RepID=UPI0008DCA0F2|nr:MULTISPECIES: hypothetical protein [unclassified Streptomyces]OII61530.1 hypothetical protein BJP40_05055 [Streptomyces sp. CC53]
MVVRKRERGGGACAVAAVAVMAAGGGLTGCSGAVDAGPAAAGRGSTAAQAVALGAREAAGAVRGAPDVLERAGTARASTFLETATGGTRLVIEGAGGYDFRTSRGRLRVVVPEPGAASSGRKPITELFTPGALYMKDRGAGVPADKWVRIDTAALADGNLVTGGATDPGAAAELLRAARHVAFVGPAEVDGVAVGHYRGTTDLGDAAEAAPPRMRGALTAAANGFATDAVPFDAYLDAEGRLRKVRHRFSFVNAGREVDVASTTVLYGFGEPVEVRLPPRRDIYDGTVEG